MRVSTLTLYARSMSSLNQQQGKLLDVGQQIASGRRVVRPSDDPQAAARAVQLDQAQAITDQHSSTRVSVRNSLSMEESILSSIGDAISSAKTLLIQANSDTLTPVDRAAIGAELQSLFETALGQANATDANGRYIFGGYQDAEQPFALDDNGEHIEYKGHSSTPAVQIDTDRKMPVGNTGAEVFKDGDDGVFRIFENALAVLSNGGAPYAVDDVPADLHDVLGQAMTDLDAAFDNVLRVRASVGSRLNELDVVDQVSANRTLNYTQAKSDLVDLDYTEAVSEYSVRMAGLQAAQKTFISMQDMNLFDLI